MKISKIYLPRMSNVSFLQFMYAIVRLVKDKDNASIGIDRQLIIGLENKLQAMQHLMLQNRKSLYTHGMKTADTQRNALFRMIVGRLRYMEYFPDDRVKAAAESVNKNILKIFKMDIVREQYMAKTSILRSFILKVREIDSAILDLTGVKILIPELEQTNTKFETEYLERNSEHSEQGNAEDLLAKKTEIIDNYKRICIILYANSLGVNPDTSGSISQREVNGLIGEFNEHIAFFKQHYQWRYHSASRDDDERTDMVPGSEKTEK